MSCSRLKVPQCTLSIVACCSFFSFALAPCHHPSPDLPFFFYFCPVSLLFPYHSKRANWSLLTSEPIKLQFPGGNVFPLCSLTCRLPLRKTPSTPSAITIPLFSFFCPPRTCKGKIESLLTFGNVFNLLTIGWQWWIDSPLPSLINFLQGQGLKCMQNFPLDIFFWRETDYWSQLTSLVDASHLTQLLTSFLTLPETLTDVGCEYLDLIQ